MKKMEKITVQMTLYEPKRHSVRYNGDGEDPGIQSLYVMNSVLKGERPKRIRVTIEEVQDGSN